MLYTLFNRYHNCIVVDTVEHERTQHSKSYWSTPEQGSQSSGPGYTAGTPGFVRRFTWSHQPYEERWGKCVVVVKQGGGLCKCVRVHSVPHNSNSLISNYRLF